MYSEPKYQGDPASTAEELLMNVSGLEETGNVVDKAVREGYFTLERALAAYQLSEVEYLAYLLLKNKGAFSTTTKEDQLLEVISYLVSVYRASSAYFAPAGKKVIQELASIAPPLPDKEVARLAHAS